MGQVFVITGPSGVGKGTLIRTLLGRVPALELAVSATTRAPRPGERDGVDYRFVPKREFLGLRDRGELLESAQVYGNFYGTPRPPIEEALVSGRDVICEVDVQGAMSIKAAVPEAILVFIEPPSLDELYERLRGRGTEDPDSLTRRVRASYDESKSKQRYDHLVVNDDVGGAVQHRLRILDEA